MKNFYILNNVKDVRAVCLRYLKRIELENVIDTGLPEFDDRYHLWRVPLKVKNNIVGEIVINALTSCVEEQRSTSKEIIEIRILKIKGEEPKRLKSSSPKISSMSNTIGIGDSEKLLKNTPDECIDLVFTSPPYFNARPEYSEYTDYKSYLLKMRKIIRQCHRVLNEGRFFVINISPILIRRASRSESSKRLAVPFDFHQIFIEEGFEFTDDIIWQKPEGAGWATGRGRRFSADRNPLQYKPVPVTEYILVYRKKTSRLIDWNIRKHPDQDIVKKSKIEDGYEVTNIWKINPTHSKKHPAVFPEELASKIVKYYSFINDVVLDPFGGIGTTAIASYKNNRRFVMYELNKEYVKVLEQYLMNEKVIYNQKKS